MNDAQRDILLLGVCPFCRVDLRKETPKVLGSLEIEKANWKGFNPFTGHMLNCRYKRELDLLWEKDVQGDR